MKENQDADEEELSDHTEATVDETTLMPSEGGEQPGQGDWSPFEEVYEAFKPARQLTVLAEDGLPTQVGSEGRSDIPPLSTETLVCMEDMSSFVVRDSFGQVTATYSPEQVVRKPNGTWWLKDESKKVEPIRPRCQHFVRQVSQWDLNPEQKAHYRLCSARRSLSGTYMSISNLAMWACSIREPRDLPSEEKYLDSFDAEKIEQGRTRVSGSIFGPGPK